MYLGTWWEHINLGTRGKNQKTPSSLSKTKKLEHSWVHAEPSQNCSSSFFAWANSPTKELGHLLFYILMISRAWPCPPDSLKDRTHSNHPFSSRTAIHRQKAILKIKSVKIKCFLKFSFTRFCPKFKKKIIKSVYMFHLVTPKKRSTFNKFYFPI
jgi:hypothetical protein